MFDGNMFLPETGTPIWKMERRRTRFAVWLPEPLTVATWMLKSLIIRRFTGCAAPSWAATSVGAIQGSFRGNDKSEENEPINYSKWDSAARAQEGSCPQCALDCGPEIGRTPHDVHAGLGKRGHLLRRGAFSA